MTRPTLAHYLRTRDELLTRAGAVLTGWPSAALQLEIGGRYPLAEAPGPTTTWRTAAAPASCC